MRKTVFLSSTGADLSGHRVQIIQDARGHDWFRFAVAAPASDGDRASASAGSAPAS